MTTHHRPPSSSTSPVTVSTDHLDPFLSDPSTAHASGSFHNDAGFLTDNSSGSDTAAEFGFFRPEFRTSQLVGTVQFYQRHVFLCYKSPKVWPSRIDAAEFDRLPRLLSAAVTARKTDMKKQTRLTICEGQDGTETSNGDVLIFPDMIRYRRLTHFDVDTFVEEVLVKDGEWLPGTPERLKGYFVFVCAHSSRDRRCGVCGPVIVSRFKEEIELHGLQGKISVSPCSHIGGHKYAGNVIIFGSNLKGEVSGHWYGYVTPEDVPILLEQHIGKGAIVDWLWRGQMGLTDDEQINSQELRLQLNGEAIVGRSNPELTQMQIGEKDVTMCRSQNNMVGCCGENGTKCCQKTISQDKVEKSDFSGTVMNIVADRKSKRVASQINGGKGSNGRKTCTMPTWFDSWEREDTYAAIAVVCAAASVAFAYSCYKKL